VLGHKKNLLTLTGASIFGAGAETDTKLTIFDASALKKQLSIFLFVNYFVKVRTRASTRFLLAYRS